MVEAEEEEDILLAEAMAVVETTMDGVRDLIMAVVVTPAINMDIGQTHPDEEDKTIAVEGISEEDIPTGTTIPRGTRVDMVGTKTITEKKWIQFVRLGHVDLGSSHAVGMMETILSFSSFFFFFFFYVYT